MTKIKGFIVASPDKRFISHSDYKSFGMTEVEAWRRAIRRDNYADELEFSACVRQYYELGYKLITAELTVYD